jgi:hypothetical protein
MDELQVGLDNLQVTGANLTTLLSKLHTAVDRVRTAKLGALNPEDKWVAPLTAAPLVVKKAKLTSLNAKRAVSAQVDRLLLELVKLEEATQLAQHSAYKYAHLKQLRAEADQDAGDDRKLRQAQQDARVEEAAKRSELAAARKRRRVVVESDDGEPSDFDLR